MDVGKVHTPLMGKIKVLKNLLDNPWIKIVGWILATTAALVAILSFLGISPKTDEAPPEPPPVTHNSIILLDATSMMNQPFDGVTKWSLSKDIVERNLIAERSDEEKISLRTFGGECSFDNAKVIVDFDLNNRRVIHNAINEIVLEGEGSLLLGVRNAIHAFGDSKQFGEKTIKNLVIIAQAEDRCESYWEGIEQELAKMEKVGKDVTFYFNIIGLTRNLEDRAWFRRIAKETGGKAFFPESVEDAERIYNLVVSHPPKDSKTSLRKFIEAMVYSFRESLHQDKFPIGYINLENSFKQCVLKNTKVTFYALIPQKKRNGFLVVSDKRERIFLHRDGKRIAHLVVYFFTEEKNPSTNISSHGFEITKDTKLEVHKIPSSLDENRLKEIIFGLEDGSLTLDQELLDNFPQVSARIPVKVIENHHFSEDKLKAEMRAVGCFSQSATDNFF